MTTILNRRGAISLAGGAFGGFVLSTPAGAKDRHLSGPSEKELAHDPDQPVLGNPKGNVTLVEFFDYQCPYCRASYEETRNFVLSDGNIRWVMKDWPIFGPVSDRATILALGSVPLGRYAEVNRALMGLKGKQLTVKQVDAAATAAGAPPAKAVPNFEKDYDKWTALVGRNMGQAAELQLVGTPTYIVGHHIFPGATDLSALKQAIAQVRKG